MVKNSGCGGRLTRVQIPALPFPCQTATLGWPLPALSCLFLPYLGAAGNTKGQLASGSLPWHVGVPAAVTGGASLRAALSSGKPGGQAVPATCSATQWLRRCSIVLPGPGPVPGVQPRAEGTFMAAHPAELPAGSAPSSRPRPTWVSRCPHSPGQESGPWRVAHRPQHRVDAPLSVPRALPTAEGRVCRAAAARALGRVAPGPCRSLLAPEVATPRQRSAAKAARARCPAAAPRLRNPSEHPAPSGASQGVRETWLQPQF